jgi:hypothetical protein
MNDLLLKRIGASEHDLEIKGEPEHIKLIAEAIAKYMDDYQVECTTLSDFRFNMEVAYQDYHNLDQDDWGFDEDSEFNELNRGHF